MFYETKNAQLCRVLLVRHGDNERHAFFLGFLMCQRGCNDCPRFFYEFLFLFLPDRVQRLRGDAQRRRSDLVQQPGAQGGGKEARKACREEGGRERPMSPRVQVETFVFGTYFRVFRMSFLFFPEMREIKCIVCLGARRIFFIPGDSRGIRETEVCLFSCARAHQVTASVLYQFHDERLVVAAYAGCWMVLVCFS